MALDFWIGAGGGANEVSDKAGFLAGYAIVRRRGSKLSAVVENLTFIPYLLPFISCMRELSLFVLLVTSANKVLTTILFQNYALWLHMTVYKNIAFGLENMKWDKEKIRKRVEELLDTLKIREYVDRYPAELSGGQQQRVSIARALARGPAVILADEPTGALDSHTSREVLGMLQDLHKQGNTVVLITHDNSIAVQAERIIRLEDGRVVYDGDAHAPEAVVQPNFMMAEPKAGEEGTQA